MKSRWLTLIACVPLAVGTMLLQSCGGVGGPTNASTSPGSNKPTQAFLALLSTQQKTAKVVGPAVCGQASCHGGPTATGHTYTTWEATAHAKNNVTCESCHGPGSIHAANPTAKDGTPNAILTFPNSTSTAVCAQCHGPLVGDYNTSMHAQVITDGVRASTSLCAECHGGVLRAQYANNGVDYTQMSTTQITNAVNEVLTPPTAAPDLACSATCTTCHDPHAKTGNLSVSGLDVQIYQPESSAITTGFAPGATAEQFANMPSTLKNPQICGQCHNGRATNGADTALTANTSRSVMQSDQQNTLMGVGGAEDWSVPPTNRTSAHASAPGQCAKCHMPSSSHTFVATPDACAPCHSPTAAASLQLGLQSEVSADLLALATRMSNWALAQGYSAQSWDFTSNIPSGQTVPNQANIPLAVQRARYNYYFIVNSGDLGVHNYAYTQYLINWSNTTLTSAGIPKVDKTQIEKIPAATRIQMIKQVRATNMKSSWTEKP